MKTKSHNKTILIFGTKSSGKSTFLNEFLNQHITYKAEPELKLITLPTGNTYIEVPDITQVVNSIKKVHDGIIKELREKCKLGVNSVVFCYPITHVRCDSDKQEIMRFIKILFKAKVPDIVLVFTFCSMLNEKELKKAKKDTVKEVKEYFEKTFNLPIKCIIFYKEPTSTLLSLEKHIRSLTKTTKDIETWSNLQMYLDNIRKESSQMLLTFAEIIEEQKRLDDNIRICEDTPNDIHHIKVPNTSQPIQTKKDILKPDTKQLMITGEGYIKNALKQANMSKK